MDRKRKRHSGNEDWTAARCQRLLRPIASRVLPLRRLSYITVPQKAPEDSTSDSAEVEITWADRNIKSDNLSSDPAWFPDHKRNPKIRQYSSRQQAQEGSDKGPYRHEHDSLIVIPTPFRARALRRGTPIKQQHGAHGMASPTFGRGKESKNVKLVKRDPFARAPLARRSAELQNRQNFEKIFELHQGVGDGFSLLLQRTVSTEKNVPGPKGAPSLLKMCLRNIPDYIQAEEEWRKSIDHDDETDVSAGVYEELEDLGVSAGRGWPGLREVVLAHGVKLVREIIKDKLVSMNTRAELANMPLRYGLHTEAEMLALTYANSLPLKRPFRGVESPLFDGCLAGLRDVGFAGVGSAKDGLCIRLVDELFRSGRLHLSWLGSRDVIKFSSEMIRSLASESGQNADALKFIHGRISQICRVELDEVKYSYLHQQPVANGLAEGIATSVHDTIIGIVTVATAIALIERNTHDPHQPPQSASLIESLLLNMAITVLQELFKYRKPGKTFYRSGGSRQPNGVCFAVLTSVLILHADASSLNNEGLHLSKGDILRGLECIHNVDSSFGNGPTTMIERAALYTCDLARCCGQSLSSSGLEYLQDLVQCFMSQPDDGLAHENALLRQLALESSLHFAKVSASQKSREFMETTESAMLRQEPLQINIPGSTRNQTTSPTRRKGLRWEEGLCEWIAATPLIATKKRSFATAGRSSAGREETIEEEGELHDSGYISGFQETPAPRKKLRRMSDLVTSPDVLGLTPGLLSHTDSSYKAQETASGSLNTKLRTHSRQPLEEKREDSLTHRATSRALQTGPTTVVEDVRPPRFEQEGPKTKTEDRTHKATLDDSQLEIVPIVVPAQAVTDTTSRPEKGKRLRKTQSPPAASSSARTLKKDQPSTDQACDIDKADTVRDGNDDEDELAMSCKKPHKSWPPRRGGVTRTQPMRSRKSLSFESKRVVPSDASEDELGG